MVLFQLPLSKNRVRSSVYDAYVSHILKCFNEGITYDCRVINNQNIYHLILPYKNMTSRDWNSFA